MTNRVPGKIAVVVGAGQTEGETVGNGRATALLPAREGATMSAAAATRRPTGWKKTSSTASWR
jgi:hypothetical protein